MSSSTIPQAQVEIVLMLFAAKFTSAKDWNKTNPRNIVQSKWSPGGKNAVSEQQHSRIHLPGGPQLTFEEPSIFGEESLGTV